MRGKLVVGNWKMHGSQQSVRALLSEIIAGQSAVTAELALCMPFPFLSMGAAYLTCTPIGLGAQNLSEHEAGAHTGEVSAAMLKEFNCSHVLVGHSERRTRHFESDADVAGKTRRALAAGLTPIVCVGETLAARQQGQAEQVLARQLDAVAGTLTPAALARVVIAYEPVWAIGSGASASPELAQAAHVAIRACLRRYDSGVAGRMRILYGGSVKPDNAARLLAMPDIDGGLIGGASLHADEFLAIARAAPASATSATAARRRQSA